MKTAAKKSFLTVINGYDAIPELEGGQAVWRLRMKR